MRDSYRTTTFEDRIEALLQSIDARLGPVRDLPAERRLPASFDEPLIARDFEGPVPGIYQRWAKEPRDPSIEFPSYEQRQHVYGLTGPQGTLWESVDIGELTTVTLITAHAGARRTELVDVDIDLSERITDDWRILKAVAGLPAPPGHDLQGFAQLVEEYADTVIERLLGTYIDAPKRL